MPYVLLLVLGLGLGGPHVFHDLGYVKASRFPTYETARGYSVTETVLVPRVPDPQDLRSSEDFLSPRPCNGSSLDRSRRSTSTPSFFQFLRASSTERRHRDAGERVDCLSRCRFDTGPPTGARLRLLATAPRTTTPNCPSHSAPPHSCSRIPCRAEKGTRFAARN